MKSRGFEKLVGEKVVKVDAEAINIVRLICESGKVLEINADDQHLGIAIVRLEVSK